MTAPMPASQDPASLSVAKLSNGLATPRTKLEDALISQANMLHEVFRDLIKYCDRDEAIICMTLAFKAQAQFRRTIETLEKLSKDKALSDTKDANP
jgi:hypothetical protein